MSLVSGFGQQVGTASGELAGAWLKNQAVGAVAASSAVPSQAADAQADAERWAAWHGYAWPFGAVFGVAVAGVTIAVLRRKKR